MSTAETRSSVRFLLGRDVVEVTPEDPQQTLLQFLRQDRGLTGTKEGCAEGDCGACSLIVGELADGVVQYRAVNACILFLPAMDGKHVLSVEHLNGDGLHPVQAAMANLHGTQCGFCTPGIVMSLVAHKMNDGGASRREIDDALAGNLCRCTGYGPIIDAARVAMSERVSDVWTDLLTAAQLQLEAWVRDDRVLDFKTPKSRYIAPRTADQLCSVLDANHGATIVAGATDVGLWVTKQGRRLDPMVSLGAVRDISGIVDHGDTVEIGAGVTYSRAHGVLNELSDSLGEMVRRIGSTQVRNSGTVCGNIANGSPIGDMPPALIALGAAVVLKSVDGDRELPLEDFFIEYGKQDRRPNEFVASVIIPKPVGDFRCYKVSKRFDQDITATLGAFQLKIEDGRLTSARVAFGGMAGTPMRAAKCEAALVGSPWNMDTIERAQTALDADFTPMSDARASATYRALAARNLLERLYLETTSDIPALELANRSTLEAADG